MFIGGHGHNWCGEGTSRRRADDENRHAGEVRDPFRRRTE
jgi:hypothetical protein